jgi:MerR family regulatory protein
MPRRLQCRADRDAGLTKRLTLTLRRAGSCATRRKAEPCFRIGEFSQIARVSGRLLRYYDSIGLLRPQRIDPETGYPRLERHLRRLCRHPSIAAALRAEQPVAKNMGLDFGAIDTMLTAHA